MTFGGTQAIMHYSRIYLNHIRDDIFIINSLCLKPILCILAQYRKAPLENREILALQS